MSAEKQEPLFVIVNHFDRPDEEGIAILRDGKMNYIHWKLCNIKAYRDMPADQHCYTPVEDFGIDLMFDEPKLQLLGNLNRASVATYPDGKPRKWQGDNGFVISVNLPPDDPTDLELKPCPFCSYDDPVFLRKEQWMFVECPECKASVKEVTSFREQVAVMWNRRDYNEVDEEAECYDDDDY